jgi:imidazole glycerol-phosphate synthase subunit HisF
MLNTRVIPSLLLKGNGLVKTMKFKDPIYIGDPINAVKIFNDKEVDELIFLDISATPQSKGPNFKLIAEIATEAFMPFGYGGGITGLNDMEKLFSLGVEKVVLNTSAFKIPGLVSEASKVFGNQSIVVSVDVKKSIFGQYRVYTNCGTYDTRQTPVEYAKRMEESGAGELVINSIDRDGTMSGYDLKLVKLVADAVNIPVVALGGAGKLSDFADAVNEGKASAVAAGSMFVFQGVHKAVLITYPPQEELIKIFK